MHFYNCWWDKRINERIFNFFGLLIIGLLPLFTLNTEVQAQQTGQLEVHVSDDQGDALPGANVFIPDLNAGQSTDDEGTAVLPGLSPGNYNVRISFVGFNTATRNIQINRGETTTLEVSLEPSVAGGQEIIVTGSRNSRAISTQQKRSALNIKEVQLADQVGNLPDRNLADALGRLTGVHVQQGTGEGQFVYIRGISPKLNKVTVNGQTSALSDVDARSGRMGPLDVIGAGNLGSIEVSKTLTPDMDAQGLGGQINVTTPSALDRGRTFAYGSADIGGHSTNDRTEGSVNFGYGDLFYDDKFGMFLGGSYSGRDFTFQAAEAEWELTDGIATPAEIVLNNNIETRNRWNLTGNFEYQFSDRSEVFVRTSWNKVNIDENRPEFEAFEVDEAPQITSSDPLRGTVAVEAGGHEHKLSDESREILNITTGTEQRFGPTKNLRLDVLFTYSNAKEIRNTRRTEFDQRPDPIPNASFDASEWLVTYDVPGGTDPGNYYFAQTRLENGNQNEDIYEAKTDLSMQVSAPLKLQVGAKALIRDRFVDETSNRWGPTQDISLTLFSRPGISNFRGGRYNANPAVDVEEFFEFRRNNPNMFEFLGVSSSTNSREDDYTADEDIYAGYALFEYKIPNFSAVGGVRIEHTEEKVSAYEAVFDESAAEEFQGFIPRGQSESYTDVFPSLQLKYNITERLLARGAFSSSLGRPSFTELAPIASFEFEQVATAGDGSPIYEGGLEEGNPALEPYKAYSYDASIEYYFGEGGIISATGFHKQIDNPIFPIERTFENITRRGRFFREFDVERFENAEEGNITGLELSYQHQYTFLPGILSGFGLALSGTITDSKISVDFRDEDLTFIGQSDFIFNGQLFYERSPIEFRVALQHNDDYFAEFGGAPVEDEYEDKRTVIDAKFTYKISASNILLFAEAKNITGENRRKYMGTPGHLLADEAFGPTYRSGISWSF